MKDGALILVRDEDEAIALTNQTGDTRSFTAQPEEHLGSQGSRAPAHNAP